MKQFDAKTLEGKGGKGTALPSRRKQATIDSYLMVGFGLVVFLCLFFCLHVSHFNLPPSAYPTAQVLISSTVQHKRYLQKQQQVQLQMQQLYFIRRNLHPSCHPVPVTPPDREGHGVMEEKAE